MGPRPDHQAFALPRALRSAPLQCDVVDLFVEHNDDLENHSTSLSYSTPERASASARTLCSGLGKSDMD